MPDQERENKKRAMWAQFHRLWTNAVIANPSYDKTQWQALEALIIETLREKAS